jgi:hypothetical protein
VVVPDDGRMPLETAADLDSALRTLDRELVEAATPDRVAHERLISKAI